MTTSNRPRLPIGILLAAMISFAVTSPRSAFGDVFEVGADGSVHLRQGAAAVQQVGATDAQDDGQEGVASSDGEVADGDERAPDLPAGAVTTVEGPAVPAIYRDALAKAAAEANISPDLLAALVWQESRWQPGAVSNKGAIGLTQLMPATAAALSVDARDPDANLAAGARYLRTLLDMFGGDVERALAAYNAGPARVVRAGGVPSIAETRAYVSTILTRLGRAGAAAFGESRP